MCDKQICRQHMQADLVYHVQHTALGKVIRAYLNIQLHNTVAFLWVLGLGAAATTLFSRRLCLLCGVSDAALCPVMRMYM